MQENQNHSQNDGHLRLISPLPVSVNHYLVPKTIYQNGKPRTILYETPESKRYKKNFALYINSEIRNQKWRPPEDKRRHFYLDCVFYFDRIDRDANNYFKLLCDAITDSGQVWPDDNVACERVQGIFYDSKDPRIEMEIYPVDYVGIFPTVNHKDAFIDTCMSCSRYTHNCSILNKAIEGRIGPDIISGQCLKFQKRKGDFR